MGRALLLMIVGAWGCTPEMSDMMMAGDPMDAGPPPEVDAWVAPADEPIVALRINHLQMRATVDSYHESGRFAMEGDPWFYDHIPLQAQATDQGIRVFDFDLDPDDLGGITLEVQATDREHDQRSQCGDWLRCLDQLSFWMDDHPDHGLLVVLVGEVSVQISEPRLHFQLDDVEYDMRCAIDRGRILAPGDVRGRYPTLGARLRAEGWPSAASTRGKAMFVLNDRAQSRDWYLERGGEDPDDKLLFVIGDPDLPDDDEVVFTFEPGVRWEFETDPAHLDRMTALAEAGYLVHGISDDPAMIGRMRAAGAHMIGTRYPEIFGEIPPTGPTACNPITAPADCDPGAIEPVE